MRRDQDVDPGDPLREPGYIVYPPVLFQSDAGSDRTRPRQAPDRLCPQGRWKTLTFLGALRFDQLTAPCVFDGPINGECFRAYVEQVLIPTLRPGDIVILDNLGSHKAKAIATMLRAVKARLWFLPKYSPDLNPIEQAFAKIKHWMRLAQKTNAEDTWRALGDLVAAFKPRECQNYFTNAGYVSVER